MACRGPAPSTAPGPAPQHGRPPALWRRRRAGFRDPGKRRDVDDLTAGGGIDARGAQAPFGLRRAAGPTGQCRAQGLAALGECGIDDGEHLFPGGRGDGRLPARERHEAGVDLGRRPEDVHADDAGLAHTAVPGRLDRGNTVGLGSRPGGQPVGHLVLDHDQAVAEAREVLKQVQDHRHGNVVRQIRHECGGFRGELGDPHGIGEDQMEIPDGVRPPLGDGGRKFAGEDRIDLDGDNRPGGVQQAQGEGPEPRPDFQYRLVRVDVRGGDDPADGVAVNDEVLAEGLGGPDPDLLGQPADIGGPHQGCGCARRRADRLSHPVIGVLIGVLPGAEGVGSVT